MPRYENLRRAVEEDHPCTDDNSCDVAAGLRYDCVLWAAHVLQGATETPATDEAMEQVRARFGSEAAFKAALDADCKRLLENPHATCPECNALVWMDDNESVTCDNCHATVKLKSDDEE
jgi:hypothetical protein